MAIVIAVRIVKIVFMEFTGTPERIAPLSSIAIKKSSLDKINRLIKTTRLRPKTKANSEFFMETIDPNKKELKPVALETKEVKTPAIPSPADVIMAMDISEYSGSFFLIISIPKAASIVETTAPTIGLKPKASPAVIPVRDEWESASPSMESLLKTIIKPIRGIIIARAPPTKKAFCINSYCNILAPFLSARAYGKLPNGWLPYLIHEDVHRVGRRLYLYTYGFSLNHGL